MPLPPEHQAFIELSILTHARAKWIAEHLGGTVGPDNDVVSGGFCYPVHPNLPPGFDLERIRRLTKG